MNVLFSSSYIDILDDMIEVAVENGSPDTIYWNEGNAIPNYVMKKLYNNPILSTAI